MTTISYTETKTNLLQCLVYARTNRLSYRVLQLALVAVRDAARGRPSEEIQADYRSLCYKYLPIDQDDENSLPEALAEIGRREDRDAAAGMMIFRISKDLGHWHGYGIRTARQLWGYLEAC